MRGLGTPAANEGSSSLIMGPSGDYYMGGYSDNKGMVSRVSPDGEVIWMKTIDFGPDPDYLMNLRLTTDNFIIGCGNSRTGGGDNDYGFVFKIDLSGTVLWKRKFVCDDLYLWANAITESSNGNYRAIGSFKNTRQDNYVIEYDAGTGAVVWDSIYAKTIDNSVDESFLDVVSHPTNNADYVCGRFQLGGGMGTYRPSLTRINEDGSFAWSKTYIYNVSPAGGRYYAFSVDKHEDSLVMGLLCRDGGTAPPFETGLIKTDLDGDISWAKLYTSPGNDIRSYNMIAFADGYLIGGWVEAADKALFLIRTNSSGDVIWSKQYSVGGTEDVIVASSNTRIVVDGTYVVTVGRTDAFGATFDAFLVKADLATGELMDGSCFEDLPIVTTVLPSFQEDYPMVVERLPITVTDPAMPEVDIDIDDSGLLVEAATDTAVGGDTLIICDGEMVDLLADWDPSLDFLWSTGETTNEITVTESGTYWVNVMVGGDCVVFSDTVTIILDDAFFDLGPDLTICDGADVLLDPGFFDGATYEWQDGSTDQTFLAGADGLYWVTVDAEFCSHTDSINVLFDVLEVDLGADTSLCEGELLVLDAENPGATYEWNDGSTDQTLTVTESGSYWVLVDNGICENPDTIDVTYSSVLVDLGDDTTLCAAASLLLDAGPGFSYLWNDGATTQTITVTIADTYSVTITDGVCSSFDEIEVDFSTPVCNFDGNPLNGCLALTVNFSDLSVADGGTITSWYWSFGDGSISTDPNPIHTYTTAGTFDVSLTITTSNGCTASQTFVDYISASDGAIAGFTISSDFISTETVVNFTNTSLNSTSWAWYFGDGAESNNANPEHVFNGPGEYVVTLIAFNENGCHDTITKTIIVKEDIFIYIPNVFTPDGDDFNEIWKPYIYGIDVYDFHLVLFNRWGEIIWESYNSGAGWNGTYGGALVQDGVYVWTIEYGDKWTDERKTITGHLTFLK